MKVVLKEQLGISFRSVDSIIELEALKITDLVNLIVRKIESQSTDQVSNAEKLALLYRQHLSTLLIDPDSNSKKLIDFTFATAILSLESFRPSEFLESSELAMSKKPMLYVHVGDIAPFVESYHLKTAPYSLVPAKGSGVLTLKDIRDIESHNRFPVEQKGHDAKHLHYTSGHPLAVGIVWTSARSKNHLRWLAIGGLFEAVEKFQYSWEKKLARHFEELGMELDEALIAIALMPQSELKALAKKTRAELKLKLIKDWVPIANPEFPALGRSGKGLMHEIESAVETLWAYHLDESKSQFHNYSVKPVKSGSPTSDHGIHF